VSRILLVGMMGAGKTTVGRLLAERFDCPYVDSDEQVEAATGRTVPELFEVDGEAAFRAAESAALAGALATDGPIVVAVAGGAVLDPANRDRLRRSGTVVWLRAEPATLAGRVGDGVGRPLLDGDPAAALDRLDRVRRPLYREVADVAVDVDGLTAAEVADEVLKALAC
jgi:shikimate kinase